MPHIHEKIDFTVEVFIVFSEKVFLRKHDKYKIWLSVGGHIELHEAPIEAATREAKEETGLEIEIFGERLELSSTPGYKEFIPPRFMNRHKISETHEHVTLVYFAKSKTDRINPTGSDQSQDYKWFTYEELDDPSYDIRESIRFYAKTALKEVK